MTQRQTELVQSTFQLVQPILEPAAMMFYDRLFELDPSLRALFRTSREEQGRHLALALTFVVNSLRPPGSPPCHGGTPGPSSCRVWRSRRALYGGGHALLWTLEQGLGDAFTPEVRDAWSAVYGPARVSNAERRGPANAGGIGVASRARGRQRLSRSPIGVAAVLESDVRRTAPHQSSTEDKELRRLHAAEAMRRVGRQSLAKPADQPRCN